MIVIELHASFLESNLLFQVRALPNPFFGAPPTSRMQYAHPLTIHLSPTSTANVIVTSFTPVQASSVPFAKIAPDGEVIVAPKARPRRAQNERTTSRSITSRRSLGARSVISTRQRSQSERRRPNSVFLRPVDQSICEDYFDDGGEDPSISHSSLTIWVDQKVLRDRTLKGVEWVCVSIMKPSSIQPVLEAHAQQKLKDAEESEAGLPTSEVVAKLLRWQYAPDSSHAALSTVLCSTLGVNGISGGVVRLSAAPPPLSKSEIDSFRLYPLVPNLKKLEGLHLGGYAKTGKQIRSEQRRLVAGSNVNERDGLLNGPVVDRQFFPPNHGTQWEGGILRFGTRPSSSREIKPQWCLGTAGKDIFTLQESAPNSLTNPFPTSYGHQWPEGPPRMVGIDELFKQIETHIIHLSSVLLIGGLGSGKTSLTKLLAHRLRCEELYSTLYLPCAKLATEETRVSTVKETLSRLLVTASWETKLAGHSLIILDDVDKLCPVETELQTADNGRSRQVSELLCSLLQDNVGTSKPVILATAQSKESLHSLIIGSNVVKEIVALKAPDKDGRREMLEALTGRQEFGKPITNGFVDQSEDGSTLEEAAWMEEPSQSPQTDNSSRFIADDCLDFLDLSGQTDGYMPGDLVLLTSRAKSEALIRAVKASDDSESGIVLTTQDFRNALQGFTPASLRNVTLQCSKTTFDLIGGLHETRKILLETLQYPTTYAPIFAQCPLRLRSGLLLYGYPGCGKTLLASAVAGECGLNFISVKGPEILNKYIGASEKSVRDLFERAESARPCVLFFDEFDSIAPKRGHDSTGVTDRVVNQLLTQMDGAEGLSGVYVLAATSRPDLIDPALLRPGRLDKSLFCDMPNTDERLDILQALAKKLTLSPAVLSEKSSSKNLAEIARRTVGYSGADLQAVIYNAHLEAIHDMLGDHNVNGEITSKKSKESKKRRHGAKPDILKFRYSEDYGNSMPLSINRTREVAENAAIIAKLDAIRSAKKKENQMRRGFVNGQEKVSANDETKENSGQNVVIDWKHIDISLATTRQSIGLDERRRLEQIYREFVAGRTGEFSDGQGSTEIGGRSSLM